MDVLPATVLLIAFVVIGAIVIFHVRNYLKSNLSPTTTFTLGELRKLRDQGAISKEEYEHAKQSIIDQSI